MVENSRPGVDNRKPIYQVRDAIKGAQDGIAPPFTEQELLHMLKLDTDKSDGLSLRKRLMGHGIPSLNPLRIIAIRKTIHLTADVIKRHKRKTATEQEQEIAAMLATAAITQFQREGVICTIGAKAIHHAPDELISPEIKKTVPKPVDKKKGFIKHMLYY